MSAGDTFSVRNRNANQSCNFIFISSSHFFSVPLSLHYPIETVKNHDLDLSEACNLRKATIAGPVNAKEGQDFTLHSYMQSQKNWDQSKCSMNHACYWFFFVKGHFGL